MWIIKLYHGIMVKLFYNDTIMPLLYLDLG